MSQFYNAAQYVVNAVKGQRKRLETDPVTFVDSGEAISFALNTLDQFRTLGIRNVSMVIKAVGNGDTTEMTVTQSAPQKPSPTPETSPEPDENTEPNEGEA